MRCIHSLSLSILAWYIFILILLFTKYHTLLIISILLHLLELVSSFSFISSLPLIIYLRTNFYDVFWIPLRGTSRRIWSVSYLRLSIDLFLSLFFFLEKKNKRTSTLMTNKSTPKLGVKVYPLFLSNVYKHDTLITSTTKSLGEFSLITVK